MGTRAGAGVKLTEGTRGGVEKTLFGGFGLWS